MFLNIAIFGIDLFKSSLWFNFRHSIDYFQISKLTAIFCLEASSTFVSKYFIYKSCLVVHRFKSAECDHETGLLRIHQLDLDEPASQLKPMQQRRNDIPHWHWKLFEKFSAVCNLSSFSHLASHLLCVWVVG